MHTRLSYNKARNSAIATPKTARTTKEEYTTLTSSAMSLRITLRRTRYFGARKCLLIGTMTRLGSWKIVTLVAKYRTARSVLTLSTRRIVSCQ